MNKTKLKVGDKVLVRKGSQKGSTGIIESINLARSTVVVKDVNLKKRHKKATSGDQTGGVFEFAQPISIANVGIINPAKPKQTTRIKIDASKDTKKRLYASNSKEIKG